MTMHKLCKHEVATKQRQYANLALTIQKRNNSHATTFNIQANPLKETSNNHAENAKRSHNNLEAMQQPQEVYCRLQIDACDSKSKYLSNTSKIESI